MRRLFTLLAVVPLLACADAPTAPVDQPAMLTTPGTPAGVDHLDIYYNGPSQTYRMSLVALEAMVLKHSGNATRIRTAAEELELAASTTATRLGLNQGGLTSMQIFMGTREVRGSFLPTTMMGVREFEIVAKKFRDIELVTPLGTQRVDPRLLEDAYRIAHTFEAY